MRVQLSRRDFMKLTGAVGAAVALGVLNTTTTQAAVATRATELTFEQQAARFLTQATLGPNKRLIDEAALLGPETWIDVQFRSSIGFLSPLTEGYLEELGDNEDFFNSTFSWAWWQQAMTSPDPLRQRIALALSEIFVISTVPDELADSPLGIANYYDMLLKNAFGNFRDLLFDVTLHPCMGFYLSHVRNRKADLAQNRFPDENYAREVMQLFSIGLFELNLDGTQKLDADGQPIPTYDNNDITELARVFTGLTYPGGNVDLEEFLYHEETFLNPMVMYASEHDLGEKRLVGGKVLPALQLPMQDIHDAIDHLFNHPNVGPFIGRSLIQRLVKSNPTPAYISRVAVAFADNGGGVRGDMKAVIKAILLDEEARDLSWMGDPHHGMLREPFIRYVHLVRALEARSVDGTYKVTGYYTHHSLKQYPMMSPSVFNFFLPNHQPLGPITDADLVAPEFQITTSVSAITGVNFLDAVTLGQYVMELPEGEDEMNVSLDIDLAEGLVADDPDALIDHLDLLLTYGTLSQEMRGVIKTAIEPLGDEPMDQVLTALYLIAISPEYAVLK